MVNWIKNHKLLLLSALVIAVLLNNRINPPITPLSTEISSRESFAPESSSFNIGASQDMIARDSGIVRPGYEKISTSDERVVIQNSSLSLLVEDVRQTGERILQTARDMGGFMVNVNYSDPEEQGYASITVRVPTERLDDALNEFRSYAVKVTSENLMGTDVTEQYEDLDERIATLTATKTKFEEILESATEVDDLLRVNQEIISLQRQIDSARGQQMALEDNARLTKITIFLSTDELALPYTPDEAFRPGVIFKKAVRSLLTTVQDLAGLAIWLGVYSVIWIPIILIIIWYKKRKKSGPGTPRTSRLN